MEYTGGSPSRLLLSSDGQRDRFILSHIGLHPEKKLCLGKLRWNERSLNSRHWSDLGRVNRALLIPFNVRLFRFEEGAPGP